MTVLTIRVALDGVKPSVWRRFKMDATMTFHDLHNVIQASMGWDDCHLYNFTCGARILTHEPEEEKDGEEAERTPLSCLVAAKKAEYVYDFGDCWDHSITVEDVSEGSLAVPVCLEGARACPPEDVGGVGGYERFLTAMNDPSHENHAMLQEWHGRMYNPAYFDIEQANRDIREYAGVALPLGPLFVEKKARPFRSLLNHEMEYAPFLWAIESNAVGVFLDDRNITDEDVAAALKALKNDPDHCEGKLAVILANELYVQMKRRPLSRQEFHLVIDYLLWCIDNRSWNPDKQAYLKWAAWHFGAFEEEERAQYEKEIRALCKKQGMPKNRIDALLSENVQCSEDEEEKGMNESTYFALPDEERDGFVLGHAADDPWLLDRHISSLLETNDHQRMRRVLEALLERVPGSPLYAGLLAEACAKSGDKESAVRWFRTAMDYLGPFKGLPTKEKEDLRSLYQQQIVKLSRAA